MASIKQRHIYIPTIYFVFFYNRENMIRHVRNHFCYYRYPYSCNCTWNNLGIDPFQSPAYRVRCRLVDLLAFSIRLEHPVVDNARAGH